MSKPTETDQAGPPPAGASDATAAAGPDAGASVEIEVESPGPSAEERIAELEAKQKDTHDRLLRSMADLENYKRRVRKEIDDAKTESSGRVLKEILPVVDNLERALAHAEKQADVGGIVEGVRLVMRQFSQSLERLGVTAIEAKGKPFDPNVHEAVSQAESDEVPPGTILEVLQTGYRIGERLLRPTLAVVSRAKAAPAASES